jgi:uncharacterized protein
MSTEGRALLTITADTCGRHDTLGGACSRESNTMRYAHDKECMHSCRDSFIRGAAGMRLRPHQARHHLQHQLLHERPCHPGWRADLRGRHLRRRQDMSKCAPKWTCCLISNCPQLNNPCNAYNPTPVEVLIFDQNCSGGL